MEFRVLGALEVTEAGSGPIPLGGPKQRAVLAHLLLRANHLVPTEVLIDEVWGEEPPEAVRNSLQSYASHLRKALGSSRLEGSRAGYLLRADPSEVDIARFQSLVRDARRMLPIDAKSAAGTFDHALALWRGPAFADLAEEPSLRAEAARLDELRLAAVEDRLEALLALGEHSGAIGELQTLTAANPLRERLWGQLMLALYRAGRQAEALTAYQRAREILADELGIDPSPELRRLQERVLQQSPDLDLHGEPLRGYRLLERVGEGSLGVLYRATQPNVGREVVVRVVHERLAGDPAFVRRFETEAQAIAALEHPHIAPIYDYWREPGRAYIVGRLLRGGSVTDRLEREGPLGSDDALRTLGQIASALSVAHRRRITHGAVQTSNVLFDDEGNAYLADFEIAAPGAATARDDVRAFASLAREVLGERASTAALEVIERAERPDARQDAVVFVDELTPAVGGTTPKAVELERAEVRNPYKGLRPFLEADEPDFYGREALVRRLVERLRGPGPRSRLLVLVGPSGSGKSSVVRAGLLPALRRGGLPDSATWFVTDMHPGHHPMEELEAALLRVAVRPPASLLEVLEAGPRGLLDATNRLVPEGSEVVLLIDQFEEAFTLVQDEAERSQFIDAIRVAVADPASRVRIVATLRADFYDRPMRYAQIGHLLGTCTEVVPPLTSDELERAVVRPAERAGLGVDAALLAQVAVDVAEQPGALPLVQYALTELVDRRSDGRLTIDAYRDIGGIGGAIAARAEQLHAGRDPADRERVRQLFLRLVTLGEGTADTRRRVPLSELSAINGDPDAMGSLLDAYGRHRLLTFDRDPATREPTVEVAHEALLSAWDRLRRWIDDAREDVRTNRRLSDAAADWQRSGRDPSFLLRGARLEQFDSWASSTSLAVGHLDREFVHTSVAAKKEEDSAEETRREHDLVTERRSVRRLRALVAVLTAAAVVGGTLTAIAIDRNADAQRASRLATARELAAAAIANLEFDPELSVLLAMRAVGVYQDAGVPVGKDAAEALHRAVRASRIVRTFEGLAGGGAQLSPDGTRLATGGLGSGSGPHGTEIVVWDVGTGEQILTLEGHSSRVIDLEFSPDGTRLVTASEDGTAIVWDANTGGPLTTMSHREVVYSASFSPDGTRVATSGVEGILRIWDAATGELVLSVDDPVGAVLGGNKFSPDGTTIAAASLDGGTATVWDARTGRAIQTIRGHERGVYSVSFSPDGRRLATAGADSTARVWDLRTGRQLLILTGHTGEIFHVAFSPDGTSLATGGTDGTARLWDSETGRELLVLSGQRAAVGNLSFNADGTLLATGSDDGTARIWNIAPEGGAEALDIVNPTPFWAGIAVSPDGTRIVAADADGRVRVWDASSGREVGSLPVGGDLVDVAFTPDGRRLAIAASSFSSEPPTTITVWDVSSGQTTLTLEPGPAIVFGITFDPDGALLAGAMADGTAVLWDATTGEVRHTLRHSDEYALGVDFSPDGSRFSTVGGEGSAKVWDVPAARELFVLSPDTGFPANSADFSPDGRSLVIALEDGTAQIWSLDSRTVMVTLTGHAGAVLDARYSPDGSLVATAGKDGSSRLWDPVSGREVLRLDGAAAPVLEVAFSPDGSRLAAIGSDGMIRVYLLRLNDLMAVAREGVTRDLTDSECRQYLHVEVCPGG